MLKRALPAPSSHQMFCACRLQDIEAARASPCSQARTSQHAPPFSAARALIRHARPLRPPFSFSNAH